jgi:hypothetical protein
MEKKIDILKEATRNMEIASKKAFLDAMSEKYDPKEKEKHLDKMADIFSKKMGQTASIFFKNVDRYLKAKD